MNPYSAAMGGVAVLAVIYTVALIPQPVPWWLYPAAMALFALSIWSLWRARRMWSEPTVQEIWDTHKRGDDHDLGSVENLRKRAFAKLGWTGLALASLISAMTLVVLVSS